MVIAMPYSLTVRQARRFLLRLHGLLGPRVLAGEAGVLAFVRQVGCIQYDPIDVCGQNAQLVLQSRVKGFQKPMLDKLLYTDRALVDYYDKEMSIWPAEDWPHFARQRARHRAQGRSLEAVDAVCLQVLDHIGQNGPMCSRDLDLDDKVHWYWSDTRLGRAALETLYFRGQLVVHHKKGTVKHYDLPHRHLPRALLEAPDPHGSAFAHTLWHVRRRIGAVGMLQCRRSDAFLGVEGIKGEGCRQAFAALLAAGEIAEAQVEGIPQPFYILARDAPLLEEVLSGAAYRPRCALIAPLDNLMWDRRVIRLLFGFEYTWEIYTPPAKRRYGYYVLPVIYGDRFIGRIEPVRGKDGVLRIKGFWPEDGRAPTGAAQKALDRALQDFAAFNGCQDIIWEEAT